MDDKPRQLALMRFAVIRELLVDPPGHGGLASAIRDLASRTWKLPDGRLVTFHFSTIESWVYIARNATDPVAALMSDARSDRGSSKIIHGILLDTLESQYRNHPSWTAKLHHKNLAAEIRRAEHLGAVIPSYATVRRTLRRQGWSRQPKPRTEGQKRAIERRARREVRQFEMPYAHALWHFDFHEGSRRVVLADGTYVKPQLVAFIDDHSRVVCHVQWYLEEDTQRLVHGLRQAILKRGLPRAVLHDNGGAMTSAEFRQGLEDLGIEDNGTLSYSPYQNGKSEAFWDTVESQLIPLLENIDPLDLSTLNRATQAWVEGEYHRERHDEIKMSPLERLTKAKSVERSPPSGEVLTRAFTQKVTRKQRRSDGTLSLCGVRFEVPSHLRALIRLTVRFRRWDLSQAWLVDPRTGDVLARVVPQDLEANASGARRPLAEPDPTPPDEVETHPAHLAALLEAYAADGMPPGFLPLDDVETT
ncbi:MAG: transposase family protein [Chromatiaceae bacterium]|nr:transposase family protein [Chromatiaceae bacterium]